MTPYSCLSVHRDGPVDQLTLDRPEKLNALDGAMIGELESYFQSLRNDAECRVVVVQGAGRAFCAGLDMHWASANADTLLAAQSPDSPALSNVILLMRSCPQVIVALVHGAACGGGFSVALAADIRIAARTARMNAAYVKLGLSGCELGTSFFLPRIVGPTVAAELLMTGRFIHAERALALGLVSEIVEEDELEAVGRALVDDLLAASAIGLRKTKETLGRVAAITDLATAIALEDHTQRLCMEATDFRASIARFDERAG